MFEIVKKLEFENKITVFKKGNTEIQLFRPSSLAKEYIKKGYDVNKNFQVWLKEGDREFKPNHLRVMLDLNLRVRSRPDLTKKLFIAFDNIFYGKDPEKELDLLKTEKFDHYLNDLIIIGVLVQLLIIEQDYCYPKESKFSPPSLFFQGWIREVIHNPKEIDNLCMSIGHNQQPWVKYTNKENKNHKQYDANLKPLWYLEDNS